MNSPIHTEVFDPYFLGDQEDPYPAYQVLRDEAPFYYNPDRDFWAISRHADVQHALREDAPYSNAMGVSLDRLSWNRHAHRVMSFLALDPPDHMRLRGLVSRAFTPRRVREMTPEIIDLTRHYLDPIIERAESGSTHAEWIEEFAGKLPMDLISQMMGVPESDRGDLRRLANMLVERDPGIDDVPAAGVEAAIELFGYYTELLKARKANLGEDLVSSLIRAEVDGDKLADHEIIGFLFLMVVAGNETTTKLLGNAFYHLSAHPDQLRQAFAQPADCDAVAARWTEETLRFDTSTQLLARHLREDVTLHGTTAPKGARAVLLIGSANRDERVFTKPDAFDINRPKAELDKTLSFGAGRHFCLGANLARLEARVVLREVIDRFASIEVDADNCQRVRSANVRGFSALPTRLVLR